MISEYIEERNGGYYIAGTRVSLDSVVYEFDKGSAPETILRSFPMIGSLERVYGAITFYLANRVPVQEYLKRQEGLRETLRSENPMPAGLKARLEKARESAKH